MRSKGDRGPAGIIRATGTYSACVIELSFEGMEKTARIRFWLSPGVGIVRYEGGAGTPKDRWEFIERKKSD